MKSNETPKLIPEASRNLSWERRRELDAIRAEAQKEASEAVALVKKLGWKPPKAKN